MFSFVFFFLHGVKTNTKKSNITTYIVQREAQNPKWAYLNPAPQKLNWRQIMKRKHKIMVGGKSIYGKLAECMKYVQPSCPVTPALFSTWVTKQVFLSCASEGKWGRPVLDPVLWMMDVLTVRGKGGHRRRSK